jgi:hypothetical protein
MWTCKHCKVEFNFNRTTEKANHTRHCKLNPNREKSYINIKTKIRENTNLKLGEVKLFQVTCSACCKQFSVKEREKLHPTKEKYFCSRICANSIGGKAKAKKYHPDESATYVAVAWRYHKRQCLVCGEDKVVAVHHYNENHNDNRPENLVPLCPTHHTYMHSRHRNLIDHLVKDYIQKFTGC